ncbi:phospholipid carrier-dependent glycosyltransferase [Pseudolysinimonas kribbensis]|uniref:Polyprenol-phosphate-mannose--protein mannosyltransferase n=1 Tax=Pseudolysinimonas kribbensis TaxID=433641 RepID=A0ABQ6K7Y0_9MICO|nr:phospholipid carrier-dependent glycosyltransferase [Pseudolysinimonas kribbensis]GMA96067.1 dolichyl-phosphate-mannose--protein mannosyltransferase [Pseudolysinimonas kribbensis]
MTVVELTGSRLDDWWQDLMVRPIARRIAIWGGPVIVLVVATLTRLVGLGQPHELVFDETYYVKDAWTIWHLGYEGSWPSDPNPGFQQGRVDTFTSAPEFIAHPPLGKWIIALGEVASGGAASSWGWRISTAVVGILLVALVMVLAHLLFRSTLLTTIAGGLMAIDGNAIVMSRVALLDDIVAFWGLVGVILVLLDRGWTLRRLTEWVAHRGEAGQPTDWGPILWWRPWLLLAAVSFGLMAGTKWSGFYFLAGFGVFVVLSEIVLRKRAGIGFYSSSSFLQQSWATFLLVVPLGLATYLATWTGWFATSGGYDRTWIQNGGSPATGLLSGVPVAVQNWWHYQGEIWNYNIHESTPHAYQANPFTWLFLVRPTSMYYHDNGNGTAAEILELANPLIWWAATAAAFFLVVRVVWGAVRRRSVWREALVLAGLGAGYLPWLLYVDRTIFQFYSIAFEPYLLLCLVATIRVLVGTRDDPAPQRVRGLALVGVFLGLCAVLSVFFWPLWIGQTIPLDYLRLHYWFPTWI